MIVLIAAEIESTRDSVREEIEAANRVASQLLGQLDLAVFRRSAGRIWCCSFCDQLGRVRANEVYLVSPAGEVLYRSPPATYKAGPRGAGLVRASVHAAIGEARRYSLRGGVHLVVEAQPSRAVLDAWDDIVRLSTVGAVMLVVVNGTRLLVGGARCSSPFPVIADGLERLQRGDLAFRLPPLAGSEANAIGAPSTAWRRRVEDKVRAERQARDAEARLEERREMASLADQRVEEERRLIAHELHDEFGQSVTAIRSLALAIAAQGGRCATRRPARRRD